MKEQLKQIIGEYYIFLDEIQMIGKKILEIYNEDKIEFNLKDDETKITRADNLSNRLICDFIKTNFSDYKIISEENKNEELTNSKTFIIDPLDGTNDFVNKTGEFSIMISLLENRKVIFGLVYIPTENTFIFAMKNKGCYSLKKNNLKKLEIQKKKDFKDFKMAISRNHFLEEEKRFCLNIGLKENNFFPLGSIGIKIFKICENKNDFYLNFSNKLGIWDVSPNEIILREAGGEIYDENLKKIEIDYSKKSKKVEQKIILTKSL